MPTPSPFSNVAKKLLIIWLVLLVIAALADVVFLSLLSLSLTGAMPFILVILWLSLSEMGKQIRKGFEIWHIRIFFIAGLYCYGTYGHKWAGDVINELFNIDAQYFGNTSAVLTVLFTPFGLLYRPELIGYAYTLFILSSSIFASYLIYLLIAPDLQDRRKRIGNLFFAVFAGSVFLALSFHMTNMFKPAVVKFAIWADFNDSHLCTDSWASEAKGVVFLDNGKVLGYYPKEGDYKFKVMPCNYDRKF